MSLLAVAGLSVELPPGWDGRIQLPDATRSGALVHAASFPLPAGCGDYGSGAVEVMGGSDVLVCLLEHEREAAAAPLFRREGIPRLRAADFSPRALQRVIPGMAGSQQFFQVAGRPFCLYVVLGSSRVIAPLVKVADRVAQSISVR